ncbi:hypothetical protein [Rufibacter aurantiacus]|uniref:hypothetical protein n=1 Tax=Rufibacter aurantiacus TaxID=2817374 RepID=UPI001B30CD8B|nr:hypothetical protein [Rufibacter aurantiacus]
MFKKLFRKKQRRLTKTEYYKKWDLFGLLEDLHAAEELLATKISGCSGSVDSVVKFREALIDEIDWLEFNNKTDLTQIFEWFLPNGVWDDFAGPEGLELGNRISERSTRWKQGQ